MSNLTGRKPYERVNPVRDKDFYDAWGRRHPHCQACGIPHWRAADLNGGVGLTRHHIIKPFRSDEGCVSGETRIQTRDSCQRIDQIVGKRVEIWNGKRWSFVEPFLVSCHDELFDVVLSDGSVLRVTKGHGWQVKCSGRSKITRRTDTAELRPGLIVTPHHLGETVGTREPMAFEYGYSIGDGYIDVVHGKPIPMACVCGDKETLPIRGRWYAPQNRKGSIEHRVSLRGIIPADRMIHMRDRTAGVPDWVFGWDKASVLEFVAGWIESDGSVVKNEASDGYRIYTTEPKARDLQLLLRRAGIDGASVRLTAEAGQVTNKGARSQDMWHVQIPSYECGEIPTRRKRATRIASKVRHCGQSLGSGVRHQKIVSITQAGFGPSYCFSEPELGMGVFGNCLTYQCNLLMLCGRDHDLAEGRSVRRNGVLMPRLTLGVCLSLKRLHEPEEWDPERLARLLGENLPDLEPIPEFLFVEWRHWMRSGVKVIGYAS